MFVDIAEPVKRWWFFLFSVLLRHLSCFTLIMAAKNVELRPDRDLLHTNFDGYRLSLDPVPVCEFQTDIHGISLMIPYITGP